MQYLIALLEVPAGKLSGPFIDYIQKWSGAG
ncbi:hypothetical protein MELB17_22880 [Marinobacter sp. ELB17]|nr:hypothetical protein MELB17_22880 [Marinobacter sp. ELB17]